MYRAAVALTLLVAAGCAVRAPQTYRLADRMLIPPGVPTASAPLKPIAAEIPVNRKSCAEDGITVARRGRGARITVSRDALLKQPSGWLAAVTTRFEQQGCLGPGEGLKLGVRVVESVPLEPAAAYRLLHSSVRETWFLDLGPENRLQVDSPIVREGADADQQLIGPSKTVRMTPDGRMEVESSTSPDLVGYETAWYAVRPKPQSYGFTFAPLYAESHIQGAVTRRPEPHTNYFHFRPDAAFYRIFHRGDQTIILVSAPNRAELDRETRALQQDPAACAGFAAQTCVLAPNNVGINTAVVVTVNGKETAVQAGGTVRAAIEAGGERNPEAVLTRLAVQKPYAGKLAAVEFDRASRDILGMILFGGEAISW